MESEEQPALSRKGWSVVVKYLHKYKKEVILLSTLGIISALANGAVPFIVGRFFDAVIAPDKAFDLLSYTLPLWVGFLGGWTLIQIVANSVDFFIDRLRRWITTHIHAYYMADSASHILTLPMSFHKEHKFGDVWDRLNRSAQSLTSILDEVIIGIGPQVLSVIVGFIFALTIKPLLAAILILGVVIYILFNSQVTGSIAKVQREAEKASWAGYGALFDALGNYETVKQSTAEEYEKERIEENFLDKIFNLWYRVRQMWTNISAFQRVVVIFTQLTIFILAAFMIQDGELTIGGLIALNGYAGMVFAPFTRLGYNWETLQNGLVSIENAQSYLDIPGENTDEHIKTPEIHGHVVFDGVEFQYAKGEPVLKGVDFEVQPGEIVAFVGESGVGKSTAISLISGYNFPSGGEVQVDGVSTDVIDLYHLRRSIAVVPQEVVLFNDTIEANIRYSRPDATDEEVRDAAENAEAHRFIEKFSDGYKQLVGERGVKLSVGEKQRVAIARAILRNPKILILDEPTSALDVQTEMAITESLDKLMKGRTTFIIAHRLSTVRRADTILVFDAGKIVERGTHSELIQKEGGLYKRLHDLHIGLRE